ncbi:hypothetical protein Ancab_035308 [Ancistrocladus abbreviatus]
MSKREITLEGEWRASTREATEKVPGSPTSPSISISVVPDSVGNSPVGELQFGAVSTAAVVAKVPKFKSGGNDITNHSPIASRPADGMEVADGRMRSQDVSGYSVGAGRRAQFATVDLATSLGGACWTLPISPAGPVGPISRSSNMGHELDINQKGGLDGPGFRSETVISSTALQRDEATGVKSIPRSPHLLLDRGRRKSKKKSLSDDIL